MTTDRRDDGSGAPKRKLIEVALPLETINRESAREKSIRHGHPSTLHLWWARRPLAAARAVLFAQLVDDPSSHPDRFPTEDAQRAERERLHGIIERLVVWENSGDHALLAEAHAEILTSTGGNPPPILDPFAGGGTIPLEAQRLGLEAHGSDLNPVAVLINKALIEIPPKFAGRPPVFPGLANSRIGSWEGATGLAGDVRAYGGWMRDEAQKRIGERYPQAMLDDGTKATVIAWIWARTVTCPNPACGIEMPLVRSWWLGKKKNKEAWVRPIIAADPGRPSGKRVEYEMGNGRVGVSSADGDGTVGRNGATCVACGSAVALEYVRATSRDVGLGAQLMAVAAEGNGRRVYLPPDAAQRRAAEVERPASAPPGELFDWPGRINVVRYGLTEFADLFTNRQLLALTTFGDLVMDARERVLSDALAAGAPPGDRLESGGTDAEAYADAVATYLGLVVADDLARARNTAVETMVRDGILTSPAGKVTLLSPAQMPADYDVATDDRVGAWEVLHHLIAILERDGVSVAGAFLANAQARPDDGIDVELVKELAFLLFSIAEKNGWTQDALAFNTVATAWPDVVQAARSSQTATGAQAAFEFEED